MGNNMEIGSSKIATIHVLAALIQSPSLLKNDKYRFSVDDFPEQFHKIVFGAIQHLESKGMERISYLDIDQFLKQYTVQYKVFCANKGVEYIQNALELYDPGKFEYYYETLKKFSLLNKLNKQGIDTTEIYDPDIIDPIESAKRQAQFDAMSVNDILLFEETKIIKAKQEFGTNSDRVESHAGEDLRELKERFKETPEMGRGLISGTLTTLFRGQRLGCLYIESAPSGSGKSRRGNSEACHLAVKEYWDIQKKEWVKNEAPENVLIISTELELSECQQMWLAFVAGVPEPHIKDGRYLPGEEERVDRAIKDIEESHLYFVSMTNYDSDDIINEIKKYKMEKDVRYVFFDYLGETLKITSSITKQTRVQGLRTDQVLLMLSSALKDAAKTLGIYIWTASQLSGDYKNAKELDAGYLRSAKSIADKVDVGSIIMPVREMDQPVIESYITKGFELQPNFVISVYKIRAGSYQNIKVYVNFDRSTCQMTDCFVTDSAGNILDIPSTVTKIVHKSKSAPEKAAEAAPVKEKEEKRWGDIIDQTSEHSFGKAYAGQEADYGDFEF